MEVIVTPSSGLHGEPKIPPDKSISHRALIIGAISKGTSVVHNISRAADPNSTRSCLEALGVRIEDFDSGVKIHGKGLRGLNKPSQVLDAENSGTTMRMLAGVLVGQPFESVVTGDASLQRRPMERIIQPLRLMGARIYGTETLTAPLRIFPSKELHGITYELPIPSAQVKSALLLAGLYAEGETAVIENLQTRDHTERYLGLETERRGMQRVIRVVGGYQPQAQVVTIPGDISAAAFFLVAALIVPDSDIVIRNVGLNPTRLGVLDVLLRMGGAIDILDLRESGGEPVGVLHARSSSLRNVSIPREIIPNIIDEIPVLAFAATSGEGLFEVRHASDLRNKESDRIAAIVNNLRSMGVEVEEYEDGFAFEGPVKLHGTVLSGCRDHRIVMANALAALRAEGPTTILEAEYVSISFPEFWSELRKLTGQSSVKS